MMHDGMVLGVEEIACETVIVSPGGRYTLAKGHEGAHGPITAGGSLEVKQGVSNGDVLVTLRKSKCDLLLPRPKRSTYSFETDLESCRGPELAWVTHRQPRMPVNATKARSAT